jgi:hypothetical protein
LHCLRVIPIHSALVTSDNPGQECYIVAGILKELLADIDESIMKLQLARYTTPKGCKNQHVHPAA